MNDELRTAALGQLIREHRGRESRTLRWLADRVAADFTYLSKIENGHDRPSRDLVARIDIALHAEGDITALFDGLPCTRCGRAALDAAAPEGSGLDAETLARATAIVEDRALATEDTPESPDIWSLMGPSIRGIFTRKAALVAAEYARLRPKERPVSRVEGLDSAEPHTGPHFVGEFSGRATSRTCPACRAALGDQDKGDQEEATLRAGGGLP